MDHNLTANHFDSQSDSFAQQKIQKTQQNHLNNKRGGHEQSGRGHAQQRGGRGGYQQQRGGYQQQRGGYQQQRGGYQQQRGGFQARGGYQQRGGNQQRDGYKQQQLNSSDNNNEWNTTPSSETDAPVTAGKPAVASVQSNNWNTTPPAVSPVAYNGWNSAPPTAASTNQWNRPIETKTAPAAPILAPTASVNQCSTPVLAEAVSATLASQCSSPAPTANSWNNKSPNVTQHASAPVAQNAAAVESDGWTTQANSPIGGSWGAMTMDSLGWTDTGKKTKNTKEDGKGVWKDGAHELGEENAEMRLKLFGTATDSENLHSGINFDKYENIPVETKGENIPEGINQVTNIVGYCLVC